MADLIEGLDKHLLQTRPDYYAKLNPGLTEDEIADLETRLGCTLPEEFKALYRWRNGQAPGNYKSFFYNYSLMDADDIAETAEMHKDLLEGGDYDVADWWVPGWVPFLSNGAGDNYCIDTVGHFDGAKGQILEFNHDYESREINYASFGKWLETTVQGLEQGLLEYNEEDGVQAVDERFDALLAELNPGYPISKWAGGARPEWLASED